MRIFTTINPNGNFDAQHEALSSWVPKFNVYSVNTKEEIEKIKGLYPYINFIETTDVYEYNGKKLVKLNAILNAIKQTAVKYAAIINSDIILNSKINLKSIADSKYLDGGIIIGTRYELDEEEEISYPFVNGYDIFIFDIRNMGILFNDNYVIGMPWWDFWVPMIIIKTRFKVYHIKNNVIFHRTHKTNYDIDIWIQIGRASCRERV